MADKDNTDHAVASARSSKIHRPLETSDLTLDEAQELVHIGSWQWDVATGGIQWSDELYRIYGLRPRAQALGFEEFVELIHPGDREMVNNIINEAYQTKHSFEFEHRIVLPNKKIRVLHGKGKVVSDNDGNVTRMFGTSQDITERKKADLALHRSDERFRAVSAATKDVVYDIDLQTGTMWFNEALHTEYKYPLKRTTYTPEWRLSLIRNEDQKRIEKSIKELLTSSDETWVGDYSFKKHDGTYIDVRDRAFVLRNAEGKPIRMIGTILDISQQKELERAKDRFISLVSHQLRTPLTSMRLLAEMLANNHEELLSPSQLDGVKKIETSAVRMIYLVNEILNLSSIETGRLNIRSVESDIPTLIRAQIEETKPLAIEKDVRIEFVEDSAAQRVNVDPMLFSQIVHNLLTNAIRYSDKPGSVVSVSFKRTDSEYVLAVHDRGIGIPKEAKAHIFTSFYRANNAVRVRGDGTGLGLYLAKLILDMADGRIWFDSTQGRGSAFYVALPHSGMKGSQGSSPAQRW